MSNAPMSWGFTARISVPAAAAASALLSTSTPWASRSAAARSGHRALAISEPTGVPLRIIPDSSASPIFPAPSTATRDSALEDIRGP